MVTKNNEIYFLVNLCLCLYKVKVTNDQSNDNAHFNDFIRSHEMCLNSQIRK